MTKTELKSLIKECIDEMYKPESFGRNPFNIKKFVLMYKDADSLFKSIDFQLPRNEPIKTAEGEFTKSQYLLNDIVRAIQKKDKAGLASAIQGLNDIVDEAKKQGKKIEADKLAKYEAFKSYLKFS